MRATRAGRRRGTTTATWVNRFASLFLLFLARDRSFAIPVWFAHVYLHARSLANVKSNMGRLGDIVTATRDLTATPVGVPVPTIQLARRFFIHLVSAPTVFQGMDTFANTFLVHSARRRRS